MQSEVISAMPIKIPIACLVLLTIGLALVNLVGLIRVEMDFPPPRLIIIFAFYLCIMWSIIYIHRKSAMKLKINISCSSRMTVP